jgi:hypothetical protein
MLAVSPGFPQGGVNILLSISRRVILMHRNIFSPIRVSTALSLVRLPGRTFLLAVILCKNACGQKQAKDGEFQRQ